MSSILIKNATVLPFTLQFHGNIDLTPRIADVKIEGERIARIAQNIEETGEQVIDATNQLLIPGFVDAHTHTVLGVLEKCGYEGLPLEIWMLYLPPDGDLDPRMHYLCTTIAALEAVKCGTTTLQDDLYAFPFTRNQHFEATAQAYLDLEVRARLSLHAINKPLHETIPYLEELLPDELKQEFTRSLSSFSIDDWATSFRDLYRDWHGKDSLLTTMLAPSASQRATPELMHYIAALSEEYDVPIHTHLLETRTQAVTGAELFGESVISYGKRHGILTHRTTIAHGIWLTPEDIELVAEAGASIVHNPVSNYRLCSGIASIRALTDSGVNIAVGTNGMDSFNLFNVIKTAGLTHSVIDSNYDRYPKAADILKWATYGGARSSMLQREIGTFAEEKKADLVLYDLNSLSFTPCYELPISLVYAESGCSIWKVFVNSQLVVEDGKVLTVNESEILAEFREKLTQYRAYRDHWHQGAAKLRQIMNEMYHHRAIARSLPIENFSGAGLKTIRKSEVSFVP